MRLISCPMRRTDIPISVCMGILSVYLCSCAAHRMLKPGCYRICRNHNTLNEIAGLEVPTLENLSIFIFNALADALPTLYKVGVHRDSLHEGCEYVGRAA